MAIQDKFCLKQKTINYFKQGYACSEAFIRAAYDCEIIDKESDIELLNKIASPFAGGVDSSGCLCGALVGAQMIVGCLIGRKDLSYPNDMVQNASKLIVDQYKAKGHVTCCRASLDDFDETLEERMHNCTKTIEDVMDILYENVIDKIKVTAST
jgi:C_GCAxxG_C_C family probable redox protein